MSLYPVLITNGARENPKVLLLNPLVCLLHYQQFLCKISEVVVSFPGHLHSPSIHWVKLIIFLSAFYFSERTSMGNFYLSTSLFSGSFSPVRPLHLCSFRYWDTWASFTPRPLKHIYILRMELYRTLALQWKLLQMLITVSPSLISENMILFMGQISYCYTIINGKFLPV